MLNIVPPGVVAPLCVGVPAPKAKPAEGAPATAAGDVAALLAPKAKGLLPPATDGVGAGPPAPKVKEGAPPAPAELLAPAPKAKVGPLEEPGADGVVVPPPDGAPKEKEGVPEEPGPGAAAPNENAGLLAAPGVGAAGEGAPKPPKAGAPLVVAEGVVPKALEPFVPVPDDED